MDFCGVLGEGIRGMVERWPGWVFMVLVSVGAVIQFWRFDEQIGFEWWQCVTGSIWVVWPMLLLSRRWRWVGFVWWGVLTVLMVVNTVFYRANPDIVTLGMILNGDSYNSFTFESGYELCQRWELFICLPYFVVAAVYVFCGRLRRWEGLKRRGKLWAWCSFVVLVLLNQVVSIGWWTLWFKDRYVPRDFKEAVEVYSTSPYRHIIKMIPQGFVEFYIIQGVRMCMPDRRLSEGERVRVCEDIQKLRGFHESEGVGMDKRNAGRNLIFVVVESWDSDVLENEEWRDAMPYVRSLTEDSASVVYVPRVLSDVGPGRSADGQFMYLNGLMPSTAKLRSVSRASLVLPSLPKALEGYRSEEYIGESGRVWNQDITFRIYGFDRMNDMLRRGMKTYYEHDSAILSRAGSLIARTEGPLFAFIATIGMHEPYTDAPDRYAVELEGDMDARDRNYLEACRRFDDAFGRFVGVLKREGLYDNSVIVLAGDHTARATALSGRFAGSRYVPMVILNGGYGGRVDGEFHQTDVFTTVMEVMGLEGVGGWQGVGRSVLSELRIRGTAGEDEDKMAPTPNPLSYDEKWWMSEAIVEGGYFNE